MMLAATVSEAIAEQRAGDEDSPRKVSVARRSLLARLGDG